MKRTPLTNGLTPSANCENACVTFVTVIYYSICKILSSPRCMHVISSVVLRTISMEAGSQKCEGAFGTGTGTDTKKREVRFVRKTRENTSNLHLCIA